MTRASNAKPIKIRYDNDDNVQTNLDSDEDGDDQDDDKTIRKQKTLDHALLTGRVRNNTTSGTTSRAKAVEEMLQRLPGRARKKRAKKVANAARFNKNYKPFDRSAHVPGYIKHGPRKVKGRGKKPNKRVHKRGD
uniref:Uncharacterized protein n=1 Tax=Lygus hesperus TaxID=30085 RepID=A0A146L6K7_LYGHE